ncbi:MAG TPA: bifunctional helix-turn-helix transcriptional regulator/GNAT family N-acetyltransferase [Verrucomicrobiae bacterium]|nr:bifunctional helix-turn-helix transcriptional regulator/GNAT family N-acetyltransferase [Verrucomicrobiae bacterium]
MGLSVARVRQFNRFYTRYAGVLHKRFLGTPFTLTESRVLFELAHADGLTATELGKALDLDNGYLSRLLQRFEQCGLLARKQSNEDGRSNLLSITAKGRQAFALLDARQHDAIAAMLSELSDDAQERLGEAMRTIQETLGGPRVDRPPYLLRTTLRPGDIGWVVARHGTLYAREYGWDETFEAFVAEICARFVEKFNPKRERCWIAECDGANAGCVFLVEKSKTVAQLRMLLVDPSARGLGIGKRLVEECIAFARGCGYRKMTLWTNDILHTARRIYEEAGFTLTKEERHHSFGHDLVGQVWDLDLTPYSANPL